MNEQPLKYEFHATRSKDEIAIIERHQNQVFALKERAVRDSLIAMG